MKPFDKNAKCTKCGSTDVHAQYHENRYCTLDCPGWKDRYGEEEHIARCCSRCSYAWLEAPIRCTDSEVRRKKDWGWLLKLLKRT